jgi:zinc-binding in reverse transcriptase
VGVLCSLCSLCENCQNIAVPNKVKKFLWILVHNRLNSAQNLQRKGWLATATCVMCSNSSPETALHLFHDCPFAAQLLLRLTGVLLQGQRSISSAWPSLAGSNR